MNLIQLTGILIDMMGDDNLVLPYCMLLLSQGKDRCQQVMNKDEKMLNSLQPDR